MFASGQYNGGNLTGAYIVKCLRWEGEVELLLVEALEDLHVDISLNLSNRLALFDVVDEHDIERKITEPIEG